MTPDAPADADEASAGDRTGFDVTPAVLAGAAGVFDAEADAIDDVVATLTAQLDALGACWGVDRVGERFGSAYVPAGRVVLANLTALATGCIRIAAALHAVADAYAATDGMVAATPSPLRPPATPGFASPGSASPAVGPVAAGIVLPVRPRWPSGGRDAEP